jgi:hypothetical protein
MPQTSRSRFQKTTQEVEEELKIQKETDEKIKDISNVYDTAIDKAIFDVQTALAGPDPNFAYLMLRKLVYASAKIAIMENCEQWMNKYEKEIALKRSYKALTAVQTMIRNRNIQAWQAEQNLQLFKKIMLILDEKGLLNRNKGYSGLDANEVLEKI